MTLWQACATVQDNLSRESLSHGHVWADASRTKRETQHNNERRHDNVKSSDLGRELAQHTSAPRALELVSSDE